MTAQTWLDEQSRPVRRWLAASIGAGVAGTVVLCAQAALLAWALNAAIFDHASWHDLWPAMAGFVGLAVLRLLLSVLARRCGFEAGSRVVTTVRARLLDQFRRLGPAWLAGQSTGDLITRTVDGVDALAPYYARYLPQKAAAVLLPLVVLVAAFPADWVAGLVLLLTAPLVPLFMVLLGGVAERASQRRWTTLTRLGSQFFDALQGLVTLRLFGAGTRRRAVLAERSELYRRETMAVLRVAFLSSLVLEFFAMVSIAVVAVLVGFRLMWGDIQFLRGMFVLLLAPEFFLPLRGLGALRHARMDALSVAEDIASTLQQPAPAANDGALPPVTPEQRPPSIAFDDVGFDYEPGRPGLAGVSLVLPGAGTAALVGPSGSGKSTLLMMLMGFLQPQRGTIRIDGVDLRDIDLAAWRQRIAWLPQRPHLFVGTVRENVMLARPDASAADLQRAAHAAGLDRVLAELPGGWETRLGEQGYGLSGGQGQRVALARAFLRDASLLLLDEPTQHLDAESAAGIEQALAELRRGRTVLQVAHRLESARAADLVAVMRDGRIAESGTPAGLAAGPGLFAQLIAAEVAS